MNRSFVRPGILGSVAGALLLSLALAGCIVAPARPYYYGGGYGGGVVSVAPPPPREEVIGIAPIPGFLWIAGYWGWAGGRHEWVPGRWEAPRQGYRYVPHAWVQEGHGWRLHEGHWDRR